MKGNVFSQWLKEFCALVFTQTVQAFLLAIILLIVIISISNGSNDANNYNNITAGGVLAIIALTSISKMESLIKKLFGLESSITDTSMKGGKGSLLGSMMALKMAKKSLDNIPKIGKGISGRFKASRDEKEAKINSANKLRSLDARYGMGGDTSADVEGSSNVPVPANNSQVNATSSSSGTSSSRRANYNEKYEDKKEKLIEEYNKKIAEAKALKKNSTRDIVSGIFETGGAIGGGIAGASMGAVLAAGTGDDILDNTTRGMGIGIGVGDTAGGYAAKGTFAPKNIRNTISSYSNTRKKMESMKADIERFEKEVKRFNAGDID